MYWLSCETLKTGFLAFFLILFLQRFYFFFFSLFSWLEDILYISIYSFYLWKASNSSQKSIIQKFRLYISIQLFVYTYIDFQLEHSNRFQVFLFIILFHPLLFTFKPHLTVRTTRRSFIQISSFLNLFNRRLLTLRTK